MLPSLLLNAEWKGKERALPKKIHFSRHTTTAKKGAIIETGRLLKNNKARFQFTVKNY